MKNILIVTGGSGGHVVPATSFFEHLKNKFSLNIVSDLRGSKFLGRSKFKYKIVDVPNLFSKPYSLPLNIFKYFLNIFQSISLLKKNKTNIVISTGGYMTFPFCLAAFILKKKIFLFEPNSVLGRSNRFALKFSTKIICYDENIKNFPTKYKLKKVLIEPILKKEIYNLEKNSINEKKGIKKILIIGGSQGASFFDKNITDLIIEISKKHELEVIQQISNKNNLPSIKEKYNSFNISYKFIEFTNDVYELYNNIDLAITRGGANTLSELSLLNIPFISIPLPSAKDNHQFFNSEYYFKKNCCWIINQNQFDLDKSSKIIFDIFDNYQNYSEKIKNLAKITKNNTWNNINNKIIEILDEN